MDQVLAERHHARAEVLRLTGSAADAGQTPMLFADVLAHRDALQRTVQALQRSITDADAGRDAARAEAERLKAQLAACRDVPPTVTITAPSGNPSDLRRLADWVEAMDLTPSRGALTYSSPTPF